MLQYCSLISCSSLRCFFKNPSNCEASGNFAWFFVAMFSFHLGISLLYKGIIQILNVTLSTEICTYAHRVVTRVETMNGKYCSGFWIRGDKMNWRYLQGREGSWAQLCITKEHGRLGGSGRQEWAEKLTLEEMWTWGWWTEQLCNACLESLRP